MQKMIHTDHSIIRSQQRGVKDEVITFVCKYGDKVNTGNETKKYFVNKKRLNVLKFKEKEFIKKHDQSILSTAVVCNGRVVVTVMKINKKVNWN